MFLKMISACHVPFWIYWSGARHLSRLIRHLNGKNPDIRAEKIIIWAGLSWKNWIIIIKIKIYCKIKLEAKIEKMSQVYLTNRRTVFPDIDLKWCRFHLGQAWNRKIQQALGLATDYIDRSGDISKWLAQFFGMPFLLSEEVEDCMSEAPDSERCVRFADYLVQNNFTSKSKFPPWESRVRLPAVC